MHLTHSLHRALQQRPHAPATIYGDRVRSVAETADRVARFAAALSGIGLREGDRVAILALNSDRYLEYYLAVPWIGTVVNPVNIRWSTAEIVYSLRDSGTTVLLVDDAFTAVLPAIRAATPELTTIIFIGDGEPPADTLDYEELIRTHEPIEDLCTGGDALYGIFYTGGTTGTPKGVMLSHDNMGVAALSGLASGHFLTPAGRMLHSAPMFHLAGFSAWNCGSLAGSTHVIVPSFTPGAVLEAVARYRVTDLVLVPTMVQMLVDDPGIDRYDLSSVRQFTYGASPISAALQARARATFPNARFSQGYGMTEAAATVVLLTPDDHDLPAAAGAAGRTVPHITIRVVDPEGNELPRGTVGEIVIQGDNVMLGYWNNPEATANAIRDGWLHTGDSGRMDDEGYVFVVDRLKDMIITGGENVYSAEVENALADHPAVATSAVIGLPDPRWGESVHAVVVLQPGRTATQAELTEHCRTLIANYKIPRSIDFTDALPVSGAGKVLKRELRDRYHNAKGTPRP